MIALLLWSFLQRLVITKVVDGFVDEWPYCCWCELMLKAIVAEAIKYLESVHFRNATCLANVPGFNSLQYDEGKMSELTNGLLWVVEIVSRMFGDMDVCGIVLGTIVLAVAHEVKTEVVRKRIRIYP